jgi:hypothetical protein
MKCRIPEQNDKNEKLRLEMRENMKKKYKDDKIKFVENLPFKVSDLIFDLISPFVSTNEDTDWETCISLGTIAWNLATLPQKEYNEGYKEILNEMKKQEDDFETYKLNLDFLIERRRENFSQYKVIIMDYKLTYKNKRPYLLVTSQFSE